jgi:ubiquinone biosynthesis protein
MKIYSIYLTYKNIKRLKEIVGVFIKHGFSHFFENTEIRSFIPLSKRYSKIKVEEKVEVRFRKVLEELGPIFIKFGQMFSRRYDILPENFLKELSILEDKVTPIPASKIMEILKREYGDRFDKIFDEIIEEPLASASIAQVHRAILKDGQEVVLKIKRPEINQMVEDDIRVIHLLVKILEEYFPELRKFSLQRVVNEFSKTIKRELNFYNEVQNLEKLRKVFSDVEIVLIPKLYKELCIEQVLVFEYVKSKKITEFTINVEEASQIQALVIEGVKVFLEKVFETGFFHADLHPGNVGITDDNKIVLYDFGNVGFLMPETSKILKALLFTIVGKDYKSFVDYLVFLGWFKNEELEHELKRDLAQAFEWRSELNLEAFDIVGLIKDIFELVRKYDIYLPVELIGFFRTLLLMESIGKLIIPRFSINEIVASVLKKELRKGFNVNETLEDLFRFIVETKKIIERTPYKIDKILNKMLNDRFTVDFVHVNLEPLIHEVARTGNKISVSLIVSALIIGTSLVFFSDKGPHIFGYPLLGVLGFISASLLGLYLLFKIIVTRRF